MDRFRRRVPGWRATARRSLAGTVIVALTTVPGALGCASIPVGAFVMVLLGLAVEKVTRSDAVAALAIVGGCVAWTFGLRYAFLRATKELERGNEAIRAVVDRAERQDLRREEALAGGAPGQVSIAAPDAPGGALSPAVGAGALSKKLPE